jgi:amylosucrase
MLYMGDELGLGNDHRWADDPLHHTDNRWLHRPPMDWEAADRRRDPQSVEGRVFAGIRDMATTRAR